MRSAAQPRGAGEQFPALGTTGHLFVTDPGAARAATTVVLDVIGRVDRAASRFRRDSDLTRVNRNAGRWVSVSDLLCRAVEVALSVAAATDGACDPTVGAGLVELGYDDAWARTGQPGARSQPQSLGGPPRYVPAAGWSRVELDAATNRIRVPVGTVLDLGATGKAWAGDLAAAAAADATGAGVLLSLGGDIAVAGPAPAQGWPVLVTDDSRTDPGDPPPTSTVVAVHTGGLATSSTTVRRLVRASSVTVHVLDPRTGIPVTGPWRTVTAAAATAAAANGATTAALVAGHRAVDWLTRRGVPARLVTRTGYVVRTGGWPAPEASAA
ncbi:MAG: FAD:protein FMN transferase [Actinomycetes bacterium]